MYCIGLVKVWVKLSLVKRPKNKIQLAVYVRILKL